MPKIALLKQYRLCKRCLERHFSTGKSTKPCYICRGLMDSLGVIANSILSAVRGFEFDTFLIGATLSTQIYEREDAMRARLKIKGKESVKYYLTRQLGIRLARLAGKKVEYGKPDITITLTVDKENKCGSCGGKGCKFCNYSGLCGYDSVEGIITKELVRLTKGQTPKFTWIGSEDQSSLVLGSGRPFYVRVLNPKKRNLKNKRIKGSGISAMLSVINDKPVIQPRFTVKTRIHIKCENVLTKNI